MLPRISPAPLALAMSLALASGLSACAPAPVPARVPDRRAAPPPPAAAATGLPTVDVFKSPACGCCNAWVEHLRQAGFAVRVHETDVLEPVRRQLGVPYGKGSCHTATVDGYVIEGHVPAADIRRLLAERPNVRGLVLPGMPAGSPGMETPDGHVQAYTVERAEHDGSTQPWAVHDR